MNLDQLDSDDDSHISRIHTQWSIVLEARKTRSDLAGAVARAELVSRYNGAIFRYFRRLLGSPQDAEDLTQEIVIKFLDGALAGADPQKGRFRDYVKTIVINAARTHRQNVAKLQAKQHAMDDQTFDGLIDRSDEESVWEDCLREDLIAEAMKALAKYEQTSGHPYSSLLDWRLKNPFSDSTEMARFLERQTGRSTTPANARKLLQRSREKLAELLLENVKKSLPADRQSGDELQEHLIALGIYEICQPTLT